MGHVVLNEQHSVHQVTDDVGVGRDLDADSTFHSADSSQSVNAGADAADTFREGPGVAGIAALQNHFNAAPHPAGGPSVGNLAVAAQNGLHAHMTLNSGQRVNDDTGFTHDDPLRYACYWSSSVPGQLRWPRYGRQRRRRQRPSHQGRPCQRSLQHHPSPEAERWFRDHRRSPCRSSRLRRSQGSRGQTEPARTGLHSSGWWSRGST